MTSIRPTGVNHKDLADTHEGTHPYSTILEEMVSMAEVWRLNDERNKRLAVEAAKAKKQYAPIDDPNQE